MTDLSDADLLGQYVHDHSEAAFTSLVERHIGLVHSVALRHTANPQHAQDITQAVFIILARKAGALGRKVVLSGWLYHTARLAAANFRRAESRRVRREQEAYMQSTLQETAPDALWSELSPLLDEGMSRLGADDRDALVLRYFQNKSLSEVGAAMGLAERAAQKRVLRAVEKLRKFFTQRGVDSTADKITETISANSIQAVPAALVKTVSAVALAKGATASVSAAALAKVTLAAMKIKTVVATAATVVIVAGISTWLAGYFHQSAAPAPAHTIDKAPVQFANANFTQDGNRDGTFLVEVDPDTLRTANSAPVIHIKGPITGDSSNSVPGSVAADGIYKKTDNSSSTKYLVTSSSVLFGKHVRITGWLKTRDVRGWASAFVIILGLDGRHLQYDDMSDRPIRGTTDWQQYEIVTDIPGEPCIIYFGPDLYGPGELWADDFQIDLAPANEPATDDRNWRITGESDPTVYSEATDFNVKHNGHPTACFTYTPNGPAPRGAHARWGRNFYGSDSAKYSGHTVRMTGWIKTENVSGHVEPLLFPYTGWYKLLAKHSMVGNNSLKGTRDWTQFSVTCVIPEDTEYLHTGFNLFGSGKVWIDMDSIKLEIVK